MAPFPTPQSRIDSLPPLTKKSSALGTLLKRKRDGHTQQDKEKMADNQLHQKKCVTPGPRVAQYGVFPNATASLSGRP